MSEAMFDKQSWSRAMGPALRSIGYFSAGLLVLTLAYLILYFIGASVGAGTLVITVAGVLGPIIIVFYFILVIFKVVDEEKIRKR